MNWSQAYLVQARSDAAAFKLLNKQKVAYCHQLHYLQMLSEKLAKGFSLRAGGTGPVMSHSGFSVFFRTLKQRPDFINALGYKGKRDAFQSFINNMMPLVKQIEALAPTIAGTQRPNPEYPWQPIPFQDVIAPADYDFPQFKPHDTNLRQLVKFIDQLLEVMQ